MYLVNILIRTLNYSMYTHFFHYIFIRRSFFLVLTDEKGEVSKYSTIKIHQYNMLYIYDCGIKYLSREGDQNKRVC